MRLAIQDERSAELRRKLVSARFELLDEYLQPHNHPWIVGYSGGKDSTLVVQLVFEMLLSLAPSDRRRPIHIVTNDTLVESPLVISHIQRSLQYF
jgi:DNA sulfur modification protein DndC